MNQSNNLKKLFTISRQYSDAVDLIWKCVKEHRYSALLGPRYSGKTEILNNIFEKMDQEKGYISIKINLYDINLSTSSLAFNRLVQLIKETLSNQYKLKLNTDHLDELNSADFRAFIQDILLRFKFNVVLILDHLEALPRDITHALLTSLRAQFMEQQSQPHRLIVIVSGALSLAIQTTGETSPFHNIVTRVIIKELSRAESNGLLNYDLARSGARLSANAREILLDATNGDSFLIQELFQRCAQRGKTARSAVNINAVIARSVVEEFILKESSQYPPFSEAVRLIEDDPNLLQSIIMLLEQGPVLRAHLPQLLLPDIDPLELTSLVQRFEDNRYAIRNEIYKRFLSEKFNPGHVGSLFLAHGRWDLAIFYLGKSIRLGDNRYISSLLETTVNAMYAANSVEHAAYYLLNGLEFAFNVTQAKVWMKEHEKDVLEQIEEMGFDKQILAQEIQVSQDSLEARAYREQITLRDQIDEQVNKIVFPLLSARKQTIGVLSIYNYSSIDRDRDIELYGYLNRTARAFNEVRLRQRQSEQIQSRDIDLQVKTNILYLLYRVSTLIQSMTDVNKVIHLILTAITAHFGMRFNRAWLFVVSENGTNLEGLSAIGEFTKEAAFAAWERFSNRTFDEYIENISRIEVLEPSNIDVATKGIQISLFPSMKDAFSFAFEKHRAIRWSRNSSMYGELPSDFQRHFESNETLITPLLVDNTCVGLLLVDNKFNKRPIDSSDEEILSTYANLCAMAIVQDHKRQSERRRLEIAETFRDVSHILSSSLELDKVLDSILLQMKRVMPFDTASIQWLNEDQNGLQIIRAIGFEDDRMIEKLCFSIEGSFPNVDVFHKKEIKRYDDIQEVYKHFSDPSFGVQLIHGWLGAPLIIEGRSKGVITLDSYTPNTYTHEHDAIAATFASQAALAIENAKSYQQQLHQKEYLDSLIRSSLDSIVAVNDRGVVVEYNERAERLCGFTREEVIGQKMRVERLYANGKYPREIQSQLIKNKHIKDYETIILSKSGQKIPVLLSASLLIGKDGAPTGSVGFFKDRRQELLVRSVGEETANLQSDHINTVLDRIAKRVCDFIGADSAIIHPYLEDQQIYDVRHIGSHGILQKSKKFGIKLRSPKSMVELLLQDKNNSVIIVDDVDMGFDRTKTITVSVSEDSFLRREQIKSFLRLSLRINDEKVGTLFINFHTPHFWTEEELNAMQVFATQAAVAIRQTRLYDLSRKEHKAIEAVNRIAALINNVDIGRLWDTILRESRHVTRAQKGRLLVWDEDKNIFFSQSAFGFEEDESSCFHDHENIQCMFLRKVVEQQDPLLIVDSVLEPFPQCCGNCSHLRSLLATPIIDPNGKAQAVLLLSSTQVGSFNNTDKKIIKSLTSYAGVAINNAINYQEIQENMQLMNGLLEAFLDVTTQKDLPTVLQAIADGARKALKCDVVTLYKYNQEKDAIAFPPTVSGQLLNETALNVLGEVSRESVVWRLLQGGESIFEHNALNNPNLSTTRVERKEGYKSFVEREQIHSCAAIVLQIHDKKVGVLFANYRSPHEFRLAERKALLLFASEAAVAINNTDLYGRLNKKSLHLQAVYNASKKVTAGVDRREILDRILEQVVEKVTQVEGEKAIAGSLQVYDEEKNELIFESVYPQNQYDIVVNKIGRSLSLKRVKGQAFGITARAAYLRRPQNVPVVEKDQDYISFSEKTRSELAIPLLDEEKLLGVLDVESDIESAFDEEDIVAIQALAELAIIALKKVDYAQDFARTNLVASMGALGAELVHHVKSTVGDIRLKTFKISKYLGNHHTDEIRMMVDEIDQYAANLNLPPLPRNPLPSGTVGLEEVAELDDVLNSESIGFQKDHPDIQFYRDFRCKKTSAVIHKFWLQRVLRHILRNSVKATDSIDAPRIHIRSRIIKGVARVEIEDNGCGVPSELEPVLFERPAESGINHSGQGLIIVRFLIEQYGGRVGFGPNKNGRGACFFFTLPIVSHIA